MISPTRTFSLATSTPRLNNPKKRASNTKKRSLLMEKCPKRSSISAFYFSNPIPPPPSRLYPRQWIFWPRKVAPGSSSVAQERSGDLKSAALSFEGALALDPKDLETTLHLAQLYFNQKRFPEAETKFRSVLELQPNFPAALLGLAQSLDAERKPEAAEAY